jgi:hypothetical protein
MLAQNSDNRAMPFDCPDLRRVTPELLPIKLTRD